MLTEKFSPTDESRRAAQKDVRLPAHYLPSSRGHYFDRRLRFTRANSSHRRGARSCSRGARFPYPALKESSLDNRFASWFYQLNVDAVLEVVMAPHLGRFRLPAGSKFVHKNDEVRIAHGDRNPSYFTKRQFNRELIAHLRLAHVGFEFEIRAVARYQPAAPDSGS